MQPIRILLFEDTEDDARAIIAQLKGHAGADPFQVVWFSSGPDFVAIRDFWSDSFPIRSTPELVHIIGDTTRPVDANTWWQQDFDGAILDVYEHRKGRVGELFARWLQHARFSGPVVIASVEDLPAGAFPFLPFVSCVTKRDEWIHQVCGRVVRGIRFCRSQAIAAVGARGRDPKRPDSVQLFWKEAEEQAKKNNREPEPAWSLWLGIDQYVRDRVLNFLGHEQINLDTFVPNCCVSVENWCDVISEVARWKSTGEDFASEARKFNLSSRVAKKIRWPGALWLDLGGRGNISDIIEQCRRARLYGVHPFMSIALLCERTTGIDEPLARQLLRNGVALVDRRAILETPGKWAEEIVERLGFFYQLMFMKPFWSRIVKWYDSSVRLRDGLRLRDAGWDVKQPAIEAVAKEEAERESNLDPAVPIVEELFRAYLGVLLIARSISYVAGDAQRPSVVGSLGSYPLSGSAVPQSFARNSKCWFRFLRHRDIISSSVYLSLVRGEADQ